MTEAEHLTEAREKFTKKTLEHLANELLEIHQGLRNLESRAEKLFFVVEELKKYTEAQDGKTIPEVIPSKLNGQTPITIGKVHVDAVPPKPEKTTDISPRAVLDQVAKLELDRDQAAYADAMGDGPKKVLAVIADAGERGAPTARITMMTKYRARTIRDYVAALIKVAFIRKTGPHTFVAMAAGVKALGEGYTLPTAEETLASLGGGVTEVFREIQKTAQRGLTVAQLRVRLKKARRTLSDYAQTLVTNGLVVRDGDLLKMSEAAIEKFGLAEDDPPRTRRVKLRSEVVEGAALIFDLVYESSDCAMPMAEIYAECDGKYAQRTVRDYVGSLVARGAFLWDSDDAVYRIHPDLLDP